MIEISFSFLLSHIPFFFSYVKLFLVWFFRPPAYIRWLENIDDQIWGKKWRNIRDRQHNKLALLNQNDTKQKKGKEIVFKKNWVFFSQRIM